MNVAPKLWLVCYDISDDKRRTRIYKTLRGYGDHLQYSVFRCALSPMRLARLRAALEELVKPSEDQVLFVMLGVADSHRSWRTIVLGRPMAPPERKARII